MHKHQIYNAVEIELSRQKKEMKNFPDHVCGQVGVINANAGMLMLSAVELKYSHLSDNKEQERMAQQAVKVIASAIRFLENLKQ
jgi:hypothetical protein